jgi:hypothetical protein
LKFKKLKIEFSEGCFDEISDEMTQEELDALKEELETMVATGEIFENAVELSSEEEAIILNELYQSEKNTRQ